MQNSGTMMVGEPGGGSGTRKQRAGMCEGPQRDLRNKNRRFVHRRDSTGPGVQTGAGQGGKNG